MRILFCPRFFRSRSSSTSSDSPQTSRYQLDRLDVPATPGRSPEGITSSRENAHYRDHRSDSSAGFSDRLRRRFSREANGPHMRPRKSDKKIGNSIFPFTTMTFKNSPNQIASADIGSSLISERGYDSDAQCITTPKQTGNFREEPRSRPGIWRDMSPLAQPNYDSDQEAQYGRSPAPMDEAGRMGSHYHGVHREMERPQASWHSRNQPRWGPPQNFSTPRNAYHENRRGRMGSPCPSMASSVSLDTTADGSKSTAQGFYYPRHRQGIQNASMPINYPRDDHQYSPTNNGGQSLNLPNCTPTFSQPYTTSAESVVYPPSQISVMKRRQRHQREQDSDGQSIHLVDMNIPRALASHSMSPHVLSRNQSLDQNEWSNRSEGQSITQPGHGYSKVETSKASAHNVGKMSKEPSSSYSRKTSISSDFPGYRWENKGVNNTSASPEKESTGAGFDGTQNRKPSPRPREVHAGQSSEFSPLNPRDHDGTDTTDIQKGRFIGQLGSNRSVSSPVPNTNCGTDESLASPRKVSVGWMSGGRRLGYGYTMVPADESIERPSHGKPATPLRTESRQGSDGATAGHTKQCSEKTSKISLRIGDSTYDISSIIQRLNPRHRATTSVEITNRSDTASCDSVTSSLWEKLGYRKKSQNEQETDADKKVPWGHFCGVGLDQTLREPPVMSKDAPASVGSEDRGRLGLSRAKTILAKGRGVGAIARELEHSIVQSKGPRVMKYKIRDLRNRRHKTDDDRPIFDNRKGSYGTSQDGEERESNPDINAVDRDEVEDPKQPSFDLVSDDWVDKIHEGLDIQPIPE
ncbi:hypothetical protein P170DRAFT_505214 [Aspergillus steynii IBT 23096]|uniref:Uncharacterized protein n=1 Tax=Aspergillus steynii IBT 23096 TaxID=1392250 RepID=A0A2I2GNJ6_9EURO|nr:uncharacterized protein P170DRAFT_505214 [Aspergillus steynii IBT 23096]PLB54454.1 hypothetical protein P170DRAFT_505214 [Aspergillus steynii IBT 23096]